MRSEPQRRSIQEEASSGRSWRPRLRGGSRRGVRAEPPGRLGHFTRRRRPSHASGARATRDDQASHRNRELAPENGLVPGPTSHYDHLMHVRGARSRLAAWSADPRPQRQSNCSSWANSCPAGRQSDSLPCSTTFLSSIHTVASLIGKPNPKFPVVLLLPPRS